MIELPLVNSDKVALIDEEFVHLTKYRWRLNNQGYVESGRHKRLHWEVMGKPQSGVHIDHVNGNRTDNRLSNLRHSTPQQNSWNSHRKPWGKTKYWGVSWNPRTHKKWQAYFQWTIIGRYETELEAAIARDLYVRRIAKEFGRYNFGVQELQALAKCTLIEH